MGSWGPLRHRGEGWVGRTPSHLKTNKDVETYTVKNCVERTRQSQKLSHSAPFPRFTYGVNPKNNSKEDMKRCVCFQFVEVLVRIFFEFRFLEEKSLNFSDALDLGCILMASPPIFGPPCWWPVPFGSHKPNGVIEMKTLPNFLPAQNWSFFWHFLRFLKLTFLMPPEPSFGSLPNQLGGGGCPQEPWADWDSW